MMPTSVLGPDAGLAVTEPVRHFWHMQIDLAGPREPGRAPDGIDIDELRAPSLEASERIETVDVVELLTPPPITRGSRVRLEQPKLSAGTWDITVWDAPTYFEWTQKTGGTTSVAGHRVEPLGEGRARLTLAHSTCAACSSRSWPCSTEGLTDRYMNREAEGMMRAAEAV